MKIMIPLFLGFGILATRAAFYTVSTIADSGPGSLRQAILDANGNPGNDSILFTTNGRVTLAEALPMVTDNTAILGSGKEQLAISGNNAVQILSFQAGTSNLLSGLALVNGLASNYANGAAIVNLGTLTINDCALRNNTNRSGWGGAVFNSGIMVISNSEFSGNQVKGEDGGINGGGGGAGSGGGGAGMGGALFCASGTVAINGSAFIYNGSTGGSAGVAGIAPGRGGGTNGGVVGVSPGGSGRSGGFGGGGGGGYYGGYPYAGNGGYGGFGGGGGGGGMSGNYNLSGSGGGGGFGGGDGAIGGWNAPGGAGGGGAGLGAAIFVAAGAVNIVGSSFIANHARGGSGAAYGRGILGSVFVHSGSAELHDSLVNVVDTSTPLETWTSQLDQYLAPVGMPMPSADGQMVFGEVVKRGSVQIALRTSFAEGSLFYSLDGSDPRLQPRPYTGPFEVRTSALLRAVAYNSNFVTTVALDALPITIIPSLTIHTSGGGAVSVSPPQGAYFSNSVAAIQAQAAPGCSFLQWLGDVGGISPQTTVTMTRNKYVEAVFGTSVGTATVGAGSIMPDPIVPIYPIGTTMRFTGKPEAGYYFARWGGLGTNNPLLWVVSSTNPTITAVFLPLPSKQFSLTVIESGSGHVLIAPRAIHYASGQVVSLAAVPDRDQSFLGWEGDANGELNPLQVTMNTNRCLTAKFTKRPTLMVGTQLEGLVEEGFRLTLTGEFETRYEILGSCNLLDWASVGTLTNTYGTSQSTDPAATNLLFRFYRAVSH
jgi:hypothetical protein